MSKKQSLDVAEVKRAITYDPKDGSFRWLQPHRNMGWGLMMAGSLYPNGYIYIGIKRVQILAHHLAWLMMCGEWPDHAIDHRNNIKTDNRWENLRPATKHQNGCNRGRQKNNTSGFKGVTRVPNGQKWKAQIHVMGRNYNLGHFSSPAEAAVAYAKAASKFHGEYARIE